MAKLQIRFEKTSLQPHLSPFKAWRWFAPATPGALEISVMR